MKNDPGLVRHDELWSALKARVNVPAVQNALRGRVSNPIRDRVYLGDDDYTVPEGPESAPWGRLVLMAPTKLWNESFARGELREVVVVAKVEFNNYVAGGWRARVAIEAVHVEVYRLLDGWVPPGPFVRLVMGSPWWRDTTPPAAPWWDGERSLWYASCEYRCRVTAPANL